MNARPIAALPRPRLAVRPEVCLGNAALSRKPTQARPNET